MQARAQMLVLVMLAVLAVVPFAFADDKPKPPPPVEVPASRSSQTWVTKPDGSRVAVGKGREFEGVRVHLSLLWDLIGVDVKTGKTLYAVNVGAFWNAYGFKQITVKGKQITAIELAPGSRARAGKDKRQYHDLRTGAKLVPDGTKAPDLGTPIKLRAVWSGRDALVEKPVRRLATTQANWDTLRTHVFGEKPPAVLGAIDFDKEVVVLLCSGNSWNCDGITLVSAHANDARLLIRTGRTTYQTMGGGRKTRPWGVFVLPREPKKTYVFERNAQNLIGGPPLWRESYRARITSPPAELKDLPPRAKTPHRGWDR